MPKNADISPYFTDLLKEAVLAAGVGGNLFNAEAEAAIAALGGDYTDTDDLIDAVNRASRVVMAHKMGLLTNAAFYADVTKYNPPTWKSYAPLDADRALQESLGRRLFNVPEDRKDAHLRISVGPGANHIVRPLIDMVRAKDIPFQFAIADEIFKRLAFRHADESGLLQFAGYWMDRNEKVTHASAVRPNSFPCPVQQDDAKDIVFEKAIERVSKRGLTGQIMFTLTAFPTELDAQIDNIPYKDYLNLFFEMCDQPDAYIEKANEYLISKLENSSTVRFTNSWGTDVSMSLIDTDGRHFTFANSQTKKNIPGSEVFSAPRRDSINGTIVSKGKFQSRSDDTKYIVNLTMVFEKGRIARFTADEGAEFFQDYLDRHPNNAYAGELGIGTNPHLKRHVANGLLVEKVSSSFHLALGEAYQITNYLGKPVHMNNGNDSLDHWDITTMLGDMYLDDDIVMKDGVFLAPELNVLNIGWNAVPVAERPERWRDYKGPFREI